MTYADDTLNMWREVARAAFTPIEIQNAARALCMAEGQDPNAGADDPDRGEESFGWHRWQDAALVTMGACVVWRGAGSAAGTFAEADIEMVARTLCLSAGGDVEAVIGDDVKGWEPYRPAAVAVMMTVARRLPGLYRPVGPEHLVYGGRPMHRAPRDGTRVQLFIGGDWTGPNPFVARWSRPKDAVYDHAWVLDDGTVWDDDPSHPILMWSHLMTGAAAENRASRTMAAEFRAIERRTGEVLASGGVEETAMADVRRIRDMINVAIANLLRPI